MDEGEKVIAQARTQLREQSPFLDFVLGQVELRPTSVISGARILFVPPRFVVEYNPAYLASLLPEQQAAVLEHELRHILHRHLERRGEREPVRWNIACDLAINDDIPHLPANTLRPPRRLRGKRAEEIYESLPTEQVSAPTCFCQAAPSSRGFQDLLGSVYRWLLGEAQRRFGKAQVTAELARLAGDLPGATQEMLPPGWDVGVHWPDILSRYCRPQRSRRTLLRPDRRGLSPWGKQRDRQRRIVAILDTSGSITATVGAAFLAELHRLRSYCSVLVVILADAAVQAVLPFEELTGKPFVGRGGTDFAPAITYVNTHLADCDLCVYLTDGCGQLPAVSSAVPLVWVVTGNKEFPGRPAVFARTAT